MIYAKITRDLIDTLERKVFKTPPPTKDEIAPNKPYWVPFVGGIDDRSSGNMPVHRWRDRSVTENEVRDVVVIEDMTPAQASSYDGTKIETALEKNIGEVDRAIAQTLFEVTNWVRVLQGNPEFTAQQFKDYLKSKIR